MSWLSLCQCGVSVMAVSLCQCDVNVMAVIVSLWCECHGCVIVVCHGCVIVSVLAVSTWCVIIMLLCQCDASVAVSVQ